MFCCFQHGPPVGGTLPSPAADILTGWEGMETVWFIKHLCEKNSRRSSPWLESSLGRHSSGVSRVGCTVVGHTSKWGRVQCIESPSLCRELTQRLSSPSRAPDLQPQMVEIRWKSTFSVPPWKAEVLFHFCLGTFPSLPSWQDGCRQH